MNAAAEKDCMRAASSAAAAFYYRPAPSTDPMPMVSGLWCGGGAPCTQSTYPTGYFQR
jgi:hypothetical protein